MVSGGHATVREEWLGVYQDEEKIGYLERRLIPNGAGYEWEEHWWLSLRLLDDVQTTHTEVHARADRACALTSFSLWSVGAGAALYVKAQVADPGTSRQTVQGESISNGDAMPFTVPLSAPLHLPPLCQMTLPAVTHSGATREFSVFNPLALRAEVVRLTTVGSELMEINGHPQRVTKLVTELGDTPLHTWVDTEGRIVKEEIAVGIVLRRESRETAASGGWREKGFSPPISTAELLGPLEGE
jgi:hypothetical protein